MKKLYIFLLTALLPLLGLSQTLSPTVVASSGGFFTNSSGSLSFTVAEMTMVQTFTSTGNILTQGFQQPEDYGVGIVEPIFISSSLITYPNPTSGSFSLQYNADEEENQTIRLYNSIGQIVMQQSFQQISGLNKIDLNISSFCQGIYMLEIDLKNESGVLKPTFHKINLLY